MNFFATARVAWIKQTDPETPDSAGKYKIGIEFVHVDNKNKENLSQELKLYYE